MAKTLVKTLAMTCLESLQHLREKTSATFQDEYCKIIAESSLKQIRNTDDNSFAKTCLTLIHHVIIEKRSVTFQMVDCNIITMAALKQIRNTTDYCAAKICLPLIEHLFIEKRLVNFQSAESKAIAVAALANQLRATEDYGSTNICLVLLQHILVEEKSVTFEMPECTIIAEAALNRLKTTDNCGLAKTYLDLIIHIAKEGKQGEIEVLVNIGMIEVLCAFLRSPVSGGNQGSSGVYQALCTPAAEAWDLVQRTMDNDMHPHAPRNRKTFLQQDGVGLIQQHLQMFPDKIKLRVLLVRCLRHLAYDSDTAGSLMTPEWLTTLLAFLNPTTEPHFPVRYWSAAALGLLAFYYGGPVHRDTPWTVEHPSHKEVEDAVTKAIDAWPEDVAPPQEFKSLYDPLSWLSGGPYWYPQSWLAHAAWIITALTTHNGERYCPLLEPKVKYTGSKTGLEILQKVIDSSNYSPTLRRLASRTIQKYQEYKHKKN